MDKLDAELSASEPLPSPIRNTALNGSPSNSPDTRDSTDTRYGETVLGTGLEGRWLDNLTPSFPSCEHNRTGPGLPSRFYGFVVTREATQEATAQMRTEDPHLAMMTWWPSWHLSYPYHRTVDELHADEAAAIPHYDNEEHPMYTGEAWLNLAIIADLNNDMRDSDREASEALATDEQGRVDDELGEQVHSRALDGSLSTPSTSKALFLTSASEGGILTTAEGDEEDQDTSPGRVSASERGNKPNEGDTETEKERAKNEQSEVAKDNN
ncbi:hypothetical protein DL768_008531 [Monosporascus sp. mg162]|nr:hypothetical protein DL768_008531 [Monosporascus sp. mg162]